MSNFKLLSPTIQKEATATSSETVLSTRPLTNLFSGTRSDRFEIQTATTNNLTIGYDLGASVTKTANSIAILRAKLLAGSYCSGVKLFGNTINSKPVSPIWEVSSLSTQTFTGGSEEDLFDEFTETSAYRYWWLEFVNSGTSSNYKVAKVIFGKALDLGREPVYPLNISRTKDNPWSRSAAYTASLNFEAISDTKKSELIEVIKEPEMALVALDEADVLFRGALGIHCSIVDNNIDPFFATENDLSITLKENI